MAVFTSDCSQIYVTLHCFQVRHQSTYRLLQPYPDGSRGARWVRGRSSRHQASAWWRELRRTAMPDGHVVAKIDFSNAFNSLRRDLMLRSLASTVPGI